MWAGTSAQTDYFKLITIAESWIVCPLLVMALAFVLYHLLLLILKSIRIATLLVQNALGWMAILSSCYVAYSMGANNAGNAVGSIANLGIVNPTILLSIGGVSIAVGEATYGKKVAYTVGKGIY